MESKTTADSSASRDTKVIDAFLRADAKYHIVPVPTGVDRQNVLEIVKSKLPGCRATPQLRKLSELAIFHNLKDLTPDFLAVLRENERLPGDIDLSFVCIITLGWIAEGEQAGQTESHFRNVLERAVFPQDRVMVLGACDALGKSEALARARGWLERQADAISRKIDQQKATSTPGDLKRLEKRRETVHRFLKNQMRALEDLVAERDAVEAAREDGTMLGKLTALYLDDTRERWYWAAMKLVREADQSEQAGQAVAAELLTLSQKYVIDDRKFEQMAAQYDEDDEAQYEDSELAELHMAILTRARCLRAAEFFGCTLDPDKSAWLAKQEDAGTDPLALRPDWEYPVFEP